MEKLDAWAQRPDAKAQEATAQKSALAEFTKQFPNADRTQFVAQIYIDEKCNVTAKMFFASKRVWFRLVVLEPENEICSWIGRSCRLLISIVTAFASESNSANSSWRFHKSSLQKIFNQNIYMCAIYRVGGP